MYVCVYVCARARAQFSNIKRNKRRLYFYNYYYICIVMKNITRLLLLLHIVITLIEPRKMHGNYKHNLINLISRNARHNRVCCIMKLLSQEK